MTTFANVVMRLFWYTYSLIKRTALYFFVVFLKGILLTKLSKHVRIVLVYFLFVKGGQ